ncbi:hypothetical protein M513_03582, partial [Trichuris suis]
LFSCQTGPHFARSFCIRFPVKAYAKNKLLAVSMPALAKLEPSSVENLTRCEVFSKRPLKRVSSRGDLVEQRADTSPCILPFRLLPGEFAHYFSSLANGGLILLTNFRIFVTMQPRGEFYNMPLLCIENVECRDMFFLHIGGKDGRTAKIPFENNESCLAWFKLLTGATAAPYKLEDIFAFAFHAWCIDEEATSSCGLRVRNSAVQTESECLDSKELVRSEFNRLQFSRSSWRITEVNANYEFCPSYPLCWIVPASVSDSDIEMCGRYRSLRRVPAVVWRHKTNGAVLVRSSQPEPGFFGWRSLADENFLQSIIKAVSEQPNSTGGSATEAENGITSDDGKSKPLLILDARSYTAAWANRAKGGGFESSEYYKRCEIQFLGLANIHSIRYSFQKFRLAIFESPEGTWFQNLETCQWLHHLCALLNASLRVVEAIHNEGRSVLVHCSDGWDRTTQIVSLAKLLLDPYYRTIKGFRELVEREWVGFGHKFAERLGMQNGDLNQRAPVFLQWLDCVHYLLREYPCSFEFSEVFLVKLAQHAYSGLFGTFLCNSAAQRKEMNILHRTFSVWDYLNEGNLQFRNFLFAIEDTVLLSCLRLRDMGSLWRTVYCPLDDPSNWKAESLLSSISDDRLVGNTSLFRAHSCDSLTSAPPAVVTPEYVTMPRRGSDSNLLIHNAKSPGNNSKPFLGNCETSRDVEDMMHTLLSRLETEYEEVTTNNNLGKLSISEDVVLAKSAFEMRLSDESGNDIPLCCGYADECLEKPMLLSSLNSAHKIEADCPDIGPVLPTQSKVKVCKIGTTVASSFSTFNCTYANNPCSIACRTHSDMVNVRHLWQQGKKFTLAELIDQDGLVKVKDSVQQRIQELVCAYEERVAILQTKLCRAQQTISAHKCIIGNLSNARHSVPAVSKPDDLKLENDALEPSSYDSKASQSDTSWEALDEAERVPTRWIPDHATQRCMGCDSEFWVINRKHHCRSCGKVFCGNCSSYECPVPEEQLFEPVRVCNSCFSALNFQQKVNALFLLLYHCCWAVSGCSSDIVCL